MPRLRSKRFHFNTYSTVFVAQKENSVELPYEYPQRLKNVKLNSGLVPMDTYNTSIKNKQPKKSEIKNQKLFERPVYCSRLLTHQNPAIGDYTVEPHLTSRKFDPCTAEKKKKIICNTNMVRQRKSHFLLAISNK